MRGARPVRQWIVLLALASGLAACAFGASIGQPNSWAWFSVGVGAALVLGAAVALTRTTRSIRRGHR